MINALNAYELQILDFIHEKLSCGFLDFLMPAVTLFGEGGIFWIAVAAILLIPKKTRKLALTLGCAFLLGLIFGNGILKNVFARIRPYDANPSALDWLLVDVLSDYSFPSGHTLVSMEAASVLLCRNRKPWGWLALGLGIAVMFSRLYLYVHYPLDVLAGCVLGVLFGLVSVLIADKAEPYVLSAIDRMKKNMRMRS